MKILIVDDLDTGRLLLRKYLQKYKCDILEAEDGNDAMGVILQYEPDLILLDIAMPNMDGVQVVEQVRSNPRVKKTPIIMITAQHTRDNVKRLGQLGVNGFLAKPFDRESVIDRIRKCIDLRPRAPEVQGLDATLQTPATVLVVDDGTELRKIIKVGYEGTSWRVTHSASIDASLTFAKRNRPDIIVIDLYFSGNPVAAIMFLKKLREDPSIFDIPVFGVVDNLDTYDKSDAEGYDINGIFGMPLDFKAFSKAAAEAAKLEGEEAGAEE